MNRRLFLRSAGTGVALALLGPGAQTWAADYGRVLVLVELQGGNDGLNTVVPFTDPDYRRLRPALALPRDRLLRLDERTGLHPSLEPLWPLWRDGSLAVVQGLGYPEPNLSHFRSIEIWDTASDSDETLDDGWVGRAFSAQPPPDSYAAHGVVVGGGDDGPLEASGARVIRLTDTTRFLRQSRLALPAGAASNAALRHILAVEQSVVTAARGLDGGVRFATTFPKTGFGRSVRTACEAIASHGGVAAVKLSIGSFDTHVGQLGRHATLLEELADGLVALRSAMLELGRWDRTLVMTYGEFGRRPRENLGAGTDHGTASSHFVLGGRVRAGLHGAAPRLDRLDGAGNLAHTLDFRALYTNVLDAWWGTDSRTVLGRRWPGLDLIKA